MLDCAAAKDLIREKYPEAVINPGILLGYDKTEDYNRFHRPYWETLAQIMTGLTPEQIAASGGVTIYDPVNEENHLALGARAAQGRITGHSSSHCGRVGGRSRSKALSLP